MFYYIMCRLFVSLCGVILSVEYVKKDVLQFAIHKFVRFNEPIIE